MDCNGRKFVAPDPEVYTSVATIRGKVEKEHGIFEVKGKLAGINVEKVVTKSGPPSDFYKFLLKCPVWLAAVEQEGKRVQKLKPFSAFDTRQDEYRGVRLPIQLASGDELATLFNAQTVALYDFILDPSQEKEDRLVALVTRIWTAMLRDCCSYACYCAHVKGSCVYCDYNKMAGITANDGGNGVPADTNGILSSKKRNGERPAAVGFTQESETFRTMSAIVETLRKVAECHFYGSLAGGHALLVLTSISASWLISLTTAPKSPAQPQNRTGKGSQKIKLVSPPFEKDMPLHCPLVNVERLNRESLPYEIVAGQIPYRHYVTELPLLSVSWWQGQGGSERKPFAYQDQNQIDKTSRSGPGSEIHDLPTRLDTQFHRDYNETIFGLYDYQTGIVDHLMVLQDSSQNWGHAAKGCDKLTGLSLLHRRLLDSITITPISPVETRSLGINRDRKTPGDRWIILIANAYQDYGLFGGIYGRSKTDAGSAIYGIGFCVWNQCLPDILSERGEGESANVFTWLSDADCYQVASWITKYMKQLHWDKGWIITCSTTLWHLIEGHHRAFTILSNSLRTFGLAQLTPKLSTPDSKESEVFKQAQKWVKNVLSHLPSDQIKVQVKDDLIESGLKVLKGEVTRLQGMNFAPCCPQHTEIFTNSCVEQVGMALLCILAATAKTPEESEIITEFADRQIGHFTPATRSLVMTLCGCEEAMMKFHALVFWNDVMDLGRRVVEYALQFDYVDKLEVDVKPPFKLCKICQTENIKSLIK